MNGINGPHENKTAPVCPATNPSVRDENNDEPTNFATNRALAGIANPPNVIKLDKPSKCAASESTIVLTLLLDFNLLMSMVHHNNIIVGA
mmetsp:Transcript_28584/g.42663  ORF Transcript_28584/g.42663 Transcript_28584/m.42663 type:complete len:90 (+) Transcript_28584:392-661(+)